MCVRVQIQEHICLALTSALLATLRLLEANCKMVSIAQFSCFQLVLHHIIDSGPYRAHPRYLGSYVRR